MLAFDIDQARANDETNPLEDMFWLMAMHKLLDSADLVVFVKSGKGAHISDVVSAFNNVKVAKPKEHLGKLLLQQMVPFPRLKFIFIGTTLDIPMEDGEIIGSAITVGTGLNNIPPEKFMVRCWRIPQYKGEAFSYNCRRDICGSSCTARTT